MARRIVGLGLALSGLLTILTGCGGDPATRAVTGGLMGAGAGAGIAAVTHGKPATGALIGAGVGAVGGAVTSP
jgi:osmotically inducible lipoprotein OsmB